MDQLCAAAEVSKRTAYQHFAGKDELVAEYLRQFDPSVLPGVFDRTDLTPRERLLAAFDIPPPPPCAPTSVPPSNSTTPSTPHPSTHATTKKPSPPGSPTPPAKPAPPTLNNSASSSRCSSTAPRPAPGSSTPTPSPPPPPSPPPSSTTPSPPQPAKTRDGRKCQADLALRDRAGRAAPRAAAPAGTRHQPPGTWPGPAGFYEPGRPPAEAAAEGRGDRQPRGPADVVGLAAVDPARSSRRPHPTSTGAPASAPVC
ncbi:TetR/AcrR family transcriptional regulator [Streptomyces sp. 142MFCol3.1]|uniref:TetR/AcrR family transcriptional regulator n=1 Tax=Streptomyces sp. 142MFCol3.1 TaxID=1172179 RepID=UPI001F2C49FE|nr:TetR/AcrR family transcriptional regulator [Streptomyces sp. 142MFCol3.1]